MAWSGASILMPVMRSFCSPLLRYLTVPENFLIHRQSNRDLASKFAAADGEICFFGRVDTVADGQSLRHRKKLELVTWLHCNAGSSNTARGHPERKLLNFRGLDRASSSKLSLFCWTAHNDRLGAVVMIVDIPEHYNASTSWVAKRLCPSESNNDGSPQKGRFCGVSLLLHIGPLD